jgi:hypothetical protein
MGRSFKAKLCVCAFLVGVPAVVHFLHTGAYVHNTATDHRTFWIGPISTTLPFGLLALLFLAHSRAGQTDSRTSPFSRSVIFGTLLAWAAMMAFTEFLIHLTPGQQNSSTMGIAIMLTPFLYLPLLVVPYAIGAVAGRVSSRWRVRSPGH